MGTCKRHNARVCKSAVQECHNGADNSGSRQCRAATLFEFGDGDSGQQKHKFTSQWVCFFGFSVTTFALFYWSDI